MTISVAVALVVLVVLAIIGFVFVWRTALPVEPKKQEKQVVEKIVFIQGSSAESRTSASSPGAFKWH